MHEKGDMIMKKSYIAPNMEKIYVLTNDVITFSENAITILDADNWFGTSINDLEFK